MSSASSTRTFRRSRPSGPVWCVTSVMPMIVFASCSASSGSFASLTPPPLPRPPAWICALTTARPPSRLAISRASVGRGRDLAARDRDAVAREDRLGLVLLRNSQQVIRKQGLHRGPMMVAGAPSRVKSPGRTRPIQSLMRLIFRRCRHHLRMPSRHSFLRSSVGSKYLIALPGLALVGFPHRPSGRQPPHLHLARGVQLVWREDDPQPAADSGRSPPIAIFLLQRATKRRGCFSARPRALWAMRAAGGPTPAGRAGCPRR